MAETVFKKVDYTLVLVRLAERSIRVRIAALLRPKLCFAPSYLRIRAYASDRGAARQNVFPLAARSFVNLNVADEELHSESSQVRQR